MISNTDMLLGVVILAVGMSFVCGLVAGFVLGLTKGLIKYDD
jgi:hypothetical protein